MARAVTVASLRELIRDLPDNTPVLLPDEDHTYRALCSASVCDVEFCRDTGFHAHYPDAKIDRTMVLKAIVISG